MAKPLRIISKLESKGLNLIKGISFDGHRVLGQTHLFAKKYYKENIDEIIYLDTVASLYSRPLLNDNIKKACQNFFIPSSKLFRSSSKPNCQHNTTFGCAI